MTAASLITEPIATKKGITIAVKRLPELIRGLQAAEAEARRRGLLGAYGDDTQPVNSGEFRHGG